MQQYQASLRLRRDGKWINKVYALLGLTTRCSAALSVLWPIGRFGLVEFLYDSER